MNLKPVKVKEPRKCWICDEVIAKDEVALYKRWWKHPATWEHPFEMLCNIEEPQRSKCLTGDHEFNAETEFEPFRGYWDPPTLTGRMVCICGEVQEEGK